MATYLITGGCGFIGSHLCDALTSDGHTVRVLDDLSTGSLGNVLEGVEFVRGSVADLITVGPLVEGVSGCFHLAAVASVERSINDWLGSHEFYVCGAVTFFVACRRIADSSCQRGV